MTSGSLGWDVDSILIRSVWEPKTLVLVSVQILPSLVAGSGRVWNKLPCPVAFPNISMVTATTLSGSPLMTMYVAPSLRLQSNLSN